MLLIRSPSIIFAFTFSIISILLTILTYNIGYTHSEHEIQFLIILPPINSIFLFLFSLTWIERRFRLSYIPFICLIILFLSSLSLTIISVLFLTLSFIMYFNFIFYLFATLIFFLLISMLIVLYLYGSLYVCRFCNTISMEQQNNQVMKTKKTLQVDKLVLKANENQCILYMSVLPGRRIRDDIRNIIDDLSQIQVDIILTLNETKEFSFMNFPNNNLYNMDIYSMHIKRSNIEHVIYSIRDHFIPKSISDYIQFLYTMIINLNRLNRNRVLIHCMNGKGRTAMTIVCFELLYDYLMKEHEQEKSQNILERMCHYPFMFEKSCRVCQSISNIRQIRQNSLLNPLQILFIHEFYARLKCPSYMEQIRNIINLHEKFLLNTFEDIRLPINI